ncbi:type II restriction enzyme NmeDIP [Aquipluma nitroreducens]|uniref:Type II restriction enzyme NmeDIP n=1 Tax=Aquipluma nitroreducens TaxID=2010828 RepID=A0A5K7SEE2_9BACT|nr:type II restriction endonuclease [Aquipluma nitroreducens]BBE19849.1 type II restriction enzyme NmeDIP [Aquipluma nitroreducens]
MEIYKTISLSKIIGQYKSDTESVYNTWFINNEDRLKAFRSIRRGVLQVIEDIKSGKFGNDFKGSSLEFVLTCITEQKQVFEGAAHPFYWKPKLRIPDIYENEKNKIAFGQFLENVLKATNEEQIIREIIRLDDLKIKGLGPAVASILYFLHPTIIPPSNTAIINGFNYLFKDKKKLGSWSEYLKIREVLIDVNKQYENEFSLDLGAISGLMFEIGTQKLLLGNDEYLSEPERKKLEALIEKRHNKIKEERQEENLHTEMQYHLIKIGTALGYDVICAQNDQSRSFNGASFSFHCLPNFPTMNSDKDTVNTIKMIDVLWFQKSTNNIIGAFEVEKSTSIYSGILRLTDLAYSIADGDEVLYIIIPDSREKDVRMQLSRPSIKSIKVPINYILFSDLRQNCDALCKFGENHHIMRKIAKSI